MGCLFPFKFFFIYYDFTVSIDINKNITFDVANITDIDQLYNIEIKSFNFPWQKEFFKYLFFERSVLIVKACLKDVIIGFFVITKELREGLKVIHILNIAVHPDYRNMGAGKRMLETIENIARNELCNVVELEVRVSNKIAIDLYKKKGFAITKILEKYYKNEDGIMMRKYIF